MYGIAKTTLGGIPKLDRTGTPTDHAWRYWKIRIPPFKFSWPSFWIRNIRFPHYYNETASRIWEDDDINIDASTQSGQAKFFWLGDPQYSLPPWPNSDKYNGLGVTQARQVYIAGIELRESWDSKNLFLDDRYSVTGDWGQEDFFSILRTYYASSLPYPTVTMRYRINQANGGSDIIFDLKRRTKIRIVGLCSNFLWYGMEVYASNDKHNWVLVFERSPQQFIKDFPHLIGSMPNTWTYDIVANQPGVAPDDPNGYRYWGMMLTSNVRRDVHSYGPADWNHESPSLYSMALSKSKGGEGAWRSEFCYDLLEYALGEEYYWNIQEVVKYVPEVLNRYDLYTGLDGFADIIWVPGQPWVFDYGIKTMFNYAQLFYSYRLSDAYVIASNDRLRWKLVKQIPFGPNMGKWHSLWD